MEIMPTTQPKPNRKKNSFPLVVDFNPRLPDIGKIINKHLHLLHESPELLALFPSGAIIPSFRRPKSIKDLVSSKRHQVSKSNQGQSLGSCFKCERKCDLCKITYKKQTILQAVKPEKDIQSSRTLNVHLTMLFTSSLAINVQCYTSVPLALNSRFVFETITRPC